MKEKLINWLRSQRKNSKIKPLAARSAKGEPEPLGGTIKAELFSVDQMERYGQRLHALTNWRRVRPPTIC